uniref:Uncharacterized protein n=1 Tax=Rhizophora mucronata TaxID=61149 RepID=A0A2P2P8S8_RHIMU
MSMNIKVQQKMSLMDSLLISLLTGLLW